MAATSTIKEYTPQYTDYLTEHAKPLTHKGWRITPLFHHSKSPMIKDWQRKNFNKYATLKSYMANIKYTGVGNVAGKQCDARTDTDTDSYIVWIDIDIDDKAFADHIRQHVNSAILNDQPSIIRGGYGRKIAIPVQLERTDTHKSYKQSTAAYYDQSGKKYQIEILNTGQQAVMYAHRKDGATYHYEDDTLTPLTLAPHQCATLNQDQIDTLFTVFNDYVSEHGYTLKKPDTLEGSNADTDNTDNNTDSSEEEEEDYQTLLETYADRIPSLEETTKILTQLDPDTDHDDWYKIGMALHHGYSGSDEAFEIWDEWSSGSEEKYKVGECAKRWSSFGKHDLHGRDPITLNTLYKMADRQHTIERATARVTRNKPWVDLDDIELLGASEDMHKLDVYIDRYLFIEEGSRVARIKDNQIHFISKLTDFKNRTANEQIVIKGEGKKEDKIIPVHRQWMAHPDRRVASTTAYSPQSPLVFQHPDKHIRLLNTYVAPRHKKTERQDLLHHTLNHISYLCNGDKALIKVVTAWIALMVQKPHKRPQITLLFIATAHGTGRGWLERLIRKLVGTQNAKTCTFEELQGGKGSTQFNDQLADCVFLSVPEIKGGSSGGQTIDASLRSVLTDSHMEINQKYGLKETKEVFSNIMLSTNHLDAIRITHDDRRIYAVPQPQEPMPQEYYRSMYDLLEGERGDELTAQTYNYMMGVDLRDLPSRSVDNAYRNMLINSRKTLAERVFQDFMTDHNPRAISLNLARYAIEQYATSHPEYQHITLDERFYNTLPHLLKDHFKMPAGAISVTLQAAFVRKHHRLRKHSVKTRLYFNSQHHPIDNVPKDTRKRNLSTIKEQYQRFYEDVYVNELFNQDAMINKQLDELDELEKQEREEKDGEDGSEWG